ncbi:MAG: molybdopterin molybdotransferase MoeA [Planctomycetaceae bacterium]|nr:molybdopterin molybdotransferase MoeA [Planctomycetaceae bacterium]
MGISVAEAISLVRSTIETGREMECPLPEALHRTLCSDLLVPHASPPFDKALMDGFAVMSASQRESGSASADPIELNVIETVVAGQVPRLPLTVNVATRIMTGAMLPKGCDCVVPIERVTFNESLAKVQIAPADLRPGANLMRSGEAAKPGDLLLAKGTRLTPQRVAALAEFGFASVCTAATPHVSIMTTGDELLDYSQPLQEGKIRNSNEPMLAAQARTCDAQVHLLGMVRDTAADLDAAIAKGLESDVLILTGGVSAGMLDLVPQRLVHAGVQRVFHGVEMKPGKPVWFGVRRTDTKSCYVFGLPGNPVSSLVCFELFVRPALRQLIGADPAPQLSAVLTQPFQVKGNRPVYHPVQLRFEGATLTATAVPWSGSADLKATTLADGMALLLPEHGAYAAGEQVPVWIWGQS